jgi:hypothetical protein
MLIAKRVAALAHLAIDAGIRELQEAHGRQQRLVLEAATPRTLSSPPRTPAICPGLAFRTPLARLGSDQGAARLASLASSERGARSVTLDDRS